MGNTANKDKKTYLSRQTTIDELQVKVSALLTIEKSHLSASGTVTRMNLMELISDG
jgi:hypothetical protein